MSPEKKEESLQDKEPILAFQFPEKKTEEVFLIELDDGSIIARTKNELEKVKKK